MAEVYPSSHLWSIVYSVFVCLCFHLLVFHFVIELEFLFSSDSLVMGLQAWTNILSFLREIFLRDLHFLGFYLWEVFGGD
jgi:hypothetical protein